MFEHLSIYTYFLGGITFSISMSIMCVCLFNALSRRVGALQISSSSSSSSSSHGSSSSSSKIL